MELDSRLKGERLGIGLGFDINHIATGRFRFDMWEDLFAAVADKVDYLSVVGINTPEHLDLFLRTAPQGLPVLHHLNSVAPAYPTGLNGKWVEWLDFVNKKIGAEWMMEDVGYWSLGKWALPYFLAPVLDEDSMLHTVENIRKLMETTSRPYLAEVPSCNFQMGQLHLYDFMNYLSEETGCGILFDCGHHFAYNLLHGRESHAGMDRLRTDRIIEIHVSGGNVNEEHPWRYMDTHMGRFSPQVSDILDRIVPQSPNLRAITLEFSGSSKVEEVIKNLNEVHEIATKHGFKGDKSHATAPL